jgi:hypothetical protein
VGPAPENGDLRAPVALRGNAVDPSLLAAIQATFAYFDDGIRSLEVLHGRFLELRRLFDGARADDELLRLVIQEGLSTMYQARSLLDLQRGLEVQGCSLAPLRPPLKGVAELLTSVGEVELPALLKLYKKAANPWVMTLLEVQFDVLLDHDISDVCAKIAGSLKDPTPPEDSALLAWCGYAVAGVDDTVFREEVLPPSRPRRARSRVGQLLARAPEGAAGASAHAPPRQGRAGDAMSALLRRLRARWLRSRSRSARAAVSPRPRASPCSAAAAAPALRRLADEGREDAATALAEALARGALVRRPDGQGRGGRGARSPTCSPQS